MSIENLDGLLLEPNVVKAAKTCLKLEDESGLLIYQSDDGRIYPGGIVTQDRNSLRRYQDMKLDMQDPKYNEAWSEFASQELSSYLEAFQFHNREQVDPKSGRLILAKWRLNEIDAETTRTLMRALSDSEMIRHPSILNQLPTTPDYLELNKLRRYHQDVALVRGESPSEDSSYVNLLVVQQKVPYMERQALQVATLADSFSSLIPDLKSMVQEHYRKLRGVLDLDERTLNLEKI